MKSLILVFAVIFSALGALTSAQADHFSLSPMPAIGQPSSYNPQGSGYNLNLGHVPGSQSYLLRCMSSGYGSTQCLAPGWIQSARVYRQYSYERCVYGYSWGVDRDILWVRDGCQADFLINIAGAYPPPPPPPANDIAYRVVCSSIGGKYAECGTPLQYIRQMYVESVFSHDSCVYGVSYGYVANRIWVNRGCRAQFVARGPQY